MRSLIVFVVVLAWSVSPMSARAVIETYEFSSTELEERYQQMSAELRCPKCQNQNIADSNAPIAKDLRRILYQQLESGASDEQILDYMVSRYGEFVRYRPEFSGATAVLWLAPLILLVMAAVVVVIALRRPRDVEDQPAQALSADEQQRLKTLVEKAERDT